MYVLKDESIEIGPGEGLADRSDVGHNGNDSGAFYCHPSAETSRKATVGRGSRIWHQAQVREGARIGCDCIVGKGAYIDFDVVIGNRVKIQNYASIYHGANIEDGVFIGPYVCLTNDKRPRAITLNGELKSDADWEVGQTRVRYGASIGAGAIVLPGVTIGRYAMVGAGALVTKDVPSYGLVTGTPATLIGYVCQCGHRLTKDRSSTWFCQVCLTQYELQEIMK